MLRRGLCSNTTALPNTTAPWQWSASADFEGWGANVTMAIIRGQLDFGKESAVDEFANRTAAIEQAWMNSQNNEPYPLSSVAYICTKSFRAYDDSDISRLFLNGNSRSVKPSIS